MAEIKVLALDLDGTLTNPKKEVTPRTRAALDAAIAKGVTIVLASGRPTAGVLPLAKELGLDKKGGCILSYNGGKIIDCRTGETLYQKQLDAQYVPELCAFAAAQNVTIITYNKEGVVTEHPDDKWALRECFTCKLPMTGVDDLAKYVDYPICKMLITLDPARRDEVWAAGKKQFDGRIDLYPSSPFFIEAVPLGVAKDGSLAALLEHMGLGRENLMACGDGLNDRSMIEYAGVGVAMKVTMMTGMRCIGRGQGVQPLLGYCVGAKNWTRYRQALRFSLALALGLSAVLTGLCYVFVRPIVRAFLTDPAAFDYGVSFARILLSTSILFGVFYVLVNALQACGAATESLIVNISRQGLVYIPAMFLLGAAFHEQGLIWAQPVADVLSLLLAAALYMRKSRKMMD